MTTTLFGIRNCDTVKKARAWLDSHAVAYVFHDFKTDGVDPDRLRDWCDAFGWETVLNRSGTTFRKLPDADRRDLDPRKALTLMLAQPSMIRRPVLESGTRRLIGFKPDQYADLFSAVGPSPIG